MRLFWALLSSFQALEMLGNAGCRVNFVNAYGHLSFHGQQGPRVYGFFLAPIPYTWYTLNMGFLVLP